MAQILVLLPVKTRGRFVSTWKLEYYWYSTLLIDTSGSFKTATLQATLFVQLGHQIAP